MKLADWNSHELAWAAGFFDGEGTIGLRRRGEAYCRLVVSASQIVRLPLDRLQRLFGGHVNGPYTRWTKQPYWIWQLDGYEKGQAAIAQMWPWLAVKRPQATTALVNARHYYSLPKRKTGPKKGCRWEIINGRRRLAA